MQRALDTIHESDLSKDPRQAITTYKSVYPLLGQALAQLSYELDPPSQSIKKKPGDPKYCGTEPALLIELAAKVRLGEKLKKNATRVHPELPKEKESLFYYCLYDLVHHLYPATMGKAKGGQVAPDLPQSAIFQNNGGFKEQFRQGWRRLRLVVLGMKSMSNTPFPELQGLYKALEVPARQSVESADTATQAVLPNIKKEVEVAYFLASLQGLNAFMGTLNKPWSQEFWAQIKGTCQKGASDV